MQLTNEFEPIREWAQERGIFSKGDTKTQFVKLLEEVGELGSSILKGDGKEFKDAIGDIVVVLTNLTELANKDVFLQEHYEDVVGDGGTRELIFTEGEITIEDCINTAFNVIKNRKGKMENGTFKKETI
jgi:NTP pyrophosphatase (non-canonical NTP hydrolase)